MEWSKCFDNKNKPESYTDVLVTDGERQWVAYTFDNINIYLASHPDYDKETKNQFAAHFITIAKPTYWMPLPTLPPE